MLSRLILLIFLAMMSHVTFAAQSSDQMTILDEINAYRHKQGLSALKINETISVEAKQHSLNMANHTVSFSHNGFDDRVARIYHSFKHPQAAAENVAYNNQGAKTIVKQWLSSREHRKNIEGDYNYTGIGVAYDKSGMIYVTQIYLRVKN